MKVTIEMEQCQCILTPCGGREQTTGQKFHQIFTNINILEFGDCIWNHHVKCIQISTNMRGIGLETSLDLRKQGPGAKQAPSHVIK